MGRVLRKKKKVDYHKAVHKYDKLGFAKSRTVTVKVTRHAGLPGRAASAPVLGAWPPLGMHGSVTYFADIANDPAWENGAADTIWLAFRMLDVSNAGWQGLAEVVAGVDADQDARDHFDDVAGTLRVGHSGPRITEAVGEAAAAICVLENYPGYRMIWGAHLHAGVGIDQIWRLDNRNGSFDYLIVEAKGPGAGLIQSPFLPPNYNQMDEGWVINHLYSMDSNWHGAGVEMVANLGLRFAVAHRNYGGGTKSYYGLAPNSQHRTSRSRLYGLVVTAQWLPDGRLGYRQGVRARYL